MIIQEGDSGSNVILLQQALNANGASLVVDGQFGPATLAAVQVFQAHNGLVQDGIVGALTQAALQGAVITPPPSSNPPPVIVAPKGMWVPTGKPRVHLVDMYHEDDINSWSELAANAVGGIHKCTLVSSSGSSMGPDAQFAARWPLFVQYGMRRGAYHWFEEGPSGQDQADYFLEHIAVSGGLTDKDRILALDYEPLGSSIGPHHNDDIEAWGDRILSKTGRIPWLYCSKSTVPALGNPSFLANWYAWIAAPSNSSAPVIAPFTFTALWQLAEQTFPGMGGDEVDVNWFPGSADELDLL